jgi:hypothetical protein
MFELRRREDIVSDYNRQLPRQTPVDILPVLHVCIFDQSPQRVEPIAMTTLGVRGAGKTPINAGGREKDWVTSQFVNIACEQNEMYMYYTAGGLTPRFQIMDSAPNGFLHAHVTKENVLGMLTAKRYSRGYPVCMNRVELAHCVKAGREKVSAGLIMQCALKCGIVALRDFSNEVITRESVNHCEACA